MFQFLDVDVSWQVLKIKVYSQYLKAISNWTLTVLCIFIVFLL